MSGELRHISPEHADQIRKLVDRATELELELTTASAQVKLWELKVRREYSVGPDERVRLSDGAIIPREREGQ